MKKQKYLLLCVAGAILMFLSLNSWAANPTYQCRITGAAQVSCNVWEFDVTINRTGSTLFNLAQWQLGILLNPAIIPSGGIINVAPVPGSSNSLNINARPGPGQFTYDAIKNCIQVSPVSPTATNFTTVLNSPAIRLCRIRVSCTLPFVAATTPNPAWNFTLASGYMTKIFALVGSVNTDITVTASHVYLAPYNPAFTGSWPDPLAQTVTTDMTEICSLPGAGATIGLANTQAGYTYYLYSDGSLVNGIGGVIFGNGSAATFTTLASGSVMTVKSPSCSGTVNMSNSINLTTTTPLVASVSIEASPGITVPESTLVTFTATPVNGGSGGPGYQWFVNGVPDYVSGFDATYIYTPLNGDQFHCEMYSSETCITPETATAVSNTITMSVITSSPPAAYNITGAGTYCTTDGGRQVGLDGSQLNVNYTLFKDAVAQPPAVAGTGLALTPASWAGMTAGTYTIYGTDDGTDPAISGTTQMLPLAGIVITSITPVTPIFPPLGPYCQGATPGTLTLTSTNGITGTWSPSTISTAASGTTVYTFTPAAGQCANTAEMSVVVNPLVTTIFTALGPYCQGETPGTLSLTSTNGITGTWSPATISTAMGGTMTEYTFTPTAGQCATTYIMEVFVTLPATPAFTALGPYCQGATPGTLSLTSTNGIAGTWSPSTISTAATGSTVYTFTPDAGQCADPTTMNIMVNAPVTPTFVALGPYCVGATPGTLMLTSTNAITGTWSPATISTVSTGSTDYTFTPDAGQCATTATMTIVVNTVPDAAGTITGPSVATKFTSEVFSVAPISNATGYAWTLPAGASISSGNNTNSVTVSFSASAVSGSITVAGTNGCGSGTVSPSHNVEILSPLMLTGTSIIDVSCNAGNNGSIEPYVTGGMTPYAFLWSNQATTPVISNLTAGTYSVTITDALDGELRNNFSVSQPLAIDITAVTSPETCTGNSNGSINLTVTGGVMPFGFQWNNGSLNEDLSAISAGIYQVTVTDANLCTHISSYTISGTDPVTPTFSDFGPYCQGATPDELPLISNNGITGTWSPGTISTATTGTIVYTFTPVGSQCATIATTSVVVMLSTGAAGIISGPAVVTQNSDPVEYSVAPITNATGYTWTLPSGAAILSGDNTNAIMVIFSELVTQQAITVAGYNDCSSGTISPTSFVTVVAPLTASTSIKDVTCYTGNDGAISLTVSGGLTPYSYQWSNGETGQNISNLTAGSYGVTITDALNNSIPLSFMVSEPAWVDISVVITPESCPGNHDGSLITELLGAYSPPVTYFWSNGAVTKDITGLAAGNYTVTVTYGTGCTLAKSLWIMAPPVPVLIITNPAAVCSPLTVNLLNPAITEGSTPGMTFTYWTDASATIPYETPATAGAGTYYIKGTSAESCSVIKPVTVVVNPLPVPTITGPDVVCFEDFDVIYTTEAGMTGYQWYVPEGCTIVSGGTNSDDFIGLAWGAPGSYTIGVNYTDENGCSAATITQHLILVESLITPEFMALGPYCQGETPGILSLTSTNGITGTWDPAVIAYGIAGAADYVFTPDEGQCANGTMMTVTIHPRPVPSLWGQEVVCLEDFGMVYTTEAGMTDYQWYVPEGCTIVSGGTDFDATIGLAWGSPGSYTIGVGYTDENGCASAVSTELTITVNPTLFASVSIEASDNNVCQGTSITFTAFPENEGTTPVYQWYNGLTPVGSDSPVYTTSDLAEGDMISVEMISNATPCLTGSPAMSNAIAMLINPVLPVSVSIDADANPVCTGSQVTFTATPVNEGGAPEYAWYLNSTLVPGETTSTYSFMPQDGDQVYVMLTSDAVCAEGNPATSNTITMSVTTTVPVSVSVVASSNPSCIFDFVTFTATPVNGGLTPAYQWFVNSLPVGTNNSHYAYVPENTDVVTVTLTSSSGCASGNPATSDPITMTVSPIETPVFDALGPYCQGATPDALPLTSNNGITGTWSPATISTAAAGSADYVFTPDPGQCAAPAMIMIVVHPLPVPSLSGPESMCFGFPAAYFTDAGMTNYQWSVSAGTTIVWGGGANDRTAGLSWSTPGDHTVSVNYTDVNGCTATGPTVLNVVVHPTITPVFTPLGPYCLGETPGTLSLTSNNGITGTWSPAVISTATAGSTDYTFTPDAGQCATTAVMTVVVTPKATPTFTALGPYCQGATPDALPLTSNNGITGTWSPATISTAAAGSTDYTFTPNAGQCSMTGMMTVVVDALPAAAGTITGPSSVEPGQTDVVFTVPSILSATGYNWSLPAGATITAGNNTNSITVSFSALAVSGIITVTGTNGCGNGTVSPDFNLTVNSGVPVNLAVDGTITGMKCYNATEIITVAETALFTVEATGHVEMIAGIAIRYKPGTKVVSGGYMWGHIAPAGPWCLPIATMPIVATVTGEDELPVALQKSSFSLYPNPTTGKFTLEQTGGIMNGTVKVAIYGLHGEKVLTKELTGEKKYELSISEFPVGLYFVKVIAGEETETLKLVKTN